MTSEPGPMPMSDAARRAFEEELAQLRSERETVSATLKGSTDTVGDTADQADELQRATQLDRIDARIADVTSRLREASVAGAPRTDAVGVGTSLTVRFSDGDVATLHITEIADEDDQASVTTDSPLGRALLGHHVGDVVGYDAPNGHATATVLSLGDPADGK